MAAMIFNLPPHFAQVSTSILKTLASNRVRAQSGVLPKFVLTWIYFRLGSAAVQIAKHFGARVTAVCSERNFELVKNLGAEFVIDYH